MRPLTGGALGRADPRHLRRGGHRRRAGPARHRVLARRRHALRQLQRGPRRRHPRRRPTRDRRRGRHGGRRELLAVEQPFANHNGGDIEIGPDGYLYIALGDGGGGGDPEGNGQDTQALLGKILRIDPGGADAATTTASRPTTRSPTARPAPPRCGSTGSATRGASPSTPRPATCGSPTSARTRSRRSTCCRRPTGAGGAPTSAGTRWRAPTRSRAASNPDGGVLPVFEYDRERGGCSVTGGVVYRGAAIPGLVGAYLFTDYCDGRLRAIRAAGGQTVDERTFDAVSGASLVSFGTDAAGEVYVLSLDGADLPPGPGVTGRARRRDPPHRHALRVGRGPADGPGRPAQPRHRGVRPLLDPRPAGRHAGPALRWRRTAGPARPRRGGHRRRPALGGEPARRAVPPRLRRHPRHGGGWRSRRSRRREPGNPFCQTSRTMWRLTSDRTRATHPSSVAGSPAGSRPTAR